MDLLVAAGLVFTEITLVQELIKVWTSPEFPAHTPTWANHFFFCQVWKTNRLNWCVHTDSRVKAGSWKCPTQCCLIRELKCSIWRGCFCCQTSCTPSTDPLSQCCSPDHFFFNCSEKSVTFTSFISTVHPDIYYIHVYITEWKTGLMPEQVNSTGSVALCGACCPPLFKHMIHRGCSEVWNKQLKPFNNVIFYVKELSYMDWNN